MSILMKWFSVYLIFTLQAVLCQQCYQQSKIAFGRGIGKIVNDLDAIENKKNELTQAHRLNAIRICQD